MQKKLNTREIQLEEKKILDCVVDLLDKNNLKYSLCAGTLLGAIRHKGFIPWDDDIDIMMPRSDYDKLQKILKNTSNILGDDLYFHSLELKNSNMPFTKVYNHNIRAYDWRYNDKYEKYLWIDIFPIDGFPDNVGECKKWFAKRNKIKKMFMYSKMNPKFLFYKKEYIKNIIKGLFKIISILIPKNYYAKKIISLTKEYPYEASKYTGCFVWGYGPQERMKKEDFENYIDVEFEGSKYKGIKEYDKYLTNLYKDYMQLPPEEKRVTHSFEAWGVENEKNKK